MISDEKISPIRKLIGSAFESPLFYKYSRGLIHFGVNLEPIKKAVALHNEDRVLDVGCGTGDYSIIVDNPKVDYLGIDASEKYIEYAKRACGNSHRSFRVLDALKMKFKENEFTKTLYISLMHHLSDKENIKVLSEINRITRDCVVIQDSSAGGWHLLNNLFWKFDRGRFIRTPEQQISLVRNTMDIVSVSNYYANSYIQRSSLIVCRPR